MGENNPRLSAFEARLAELRKKMESGLGERAARIAAHLAALDTQPHVSREGLRHEAHKLRGVAGTFGHAALGEHAGVLERLALSGPPGHVATLAQQLIDAVRSAGIAVPITAHAEVNTAASTNREPVAGPATNAPATTRHLLAIDDDAETRKLLDLTLRQLGGYPTTVASNGTEGLSLLRDGGFDLVLCDAMMPDMNGLTFCERARALGLTHLPPIVILSAATSQELGWDVNVAHAPFAWWRKPFRPKELIAQLNVLWPAA